ncbi:MAG: hypothetical protein ACTSYI_14470 [Promethearchaeota archaeon]
MDANSMPNVDGDFSYRVILCKYSEIALKSEPYQKKIFTILIDSVKRICIRENLHLQSVLNLPGRLLFFFPPENISRACRVFQYIIGIQSFAPAVSSPRKIEKLAQKVIHYASTLQQTQNIRSITLKLRSPLMTSERIQDFQKELTNRIEELLYQQKNNLIIAPKQADIVLEIEIREKGSYLYHMEFPTHFAGFPIESNKVFFLPWTNSPYEFLTAMMVIRRGAIVIPIKLNSPLGLVGWERERGRGNRSEGANINPETKNQGSSIIYSPEYDKIALLAKYYGDPLPVISLSVESFDNIFEQTNLQGRELMELYKGIFLYLVNQIGVDSLIRSRLRMGNRKLHIKGILFAPVDLGIQNSPESLTASNKPSMFLPYFFPLAGLNASNIQNILHDYGTDPSNFSFQRSWLSSISEHSGLYIDPERNNPNTGEHISLRSNVISAIQHSTGILSDLSTDEIFSHLHLGWIQGEIIEP